MGKNDDSVLQGRRNKRWHKFMAWSVNFINSWLEAGKMVPLADGTITKFDTIDVTPQEQRFLNGQWLKFRRWRDEFCQERKIVEGLTGSGKAFYRDASSDLRLVVAACDVYDKDLTHTDALRIQTYLLYAFMHDLSNVTGEVKTRAHKLMLQTLETLANHMLPKDSPLVLVMNQVYWTTRDVILCEPTWPEGYWDMSQYTEQESYISRKPVRMESEAMRRLYAWRNTTPKIERVA